MPPPRARTPLEIELYLALHPCACGEASFPATSSVVEYDDDLANRYAGRCPRCDAEREFVFGLPERAHGGRPGHVTYGDDTPSQLLDPGEWLWTADRFARGVPADVTGLAGGARRGARHRLLSAAAAMDEVVKFVPSGLEQVPETAFWSERGRAVFAEEPGRFFRDRLEVVADTYREMAGELQDA